MEEFNTGVCGGLADGLLDGCRVSGGVEDEEDGRPCAGEGCAVDAFHSTGEGKKAWKQRAAFGTVGVMDEVLHGVAEEVRAVQGEGGDEEGGTLDVGDCVRPSVGGWEQGARLFRSERSAGEGEQQMPRERLAKGSSLDLAILLGGDGESAKGAGSDVVRVAFAQACFGEDLVGSPVQATEVAGEVDSGEERGGG